MYGDAQSIRVYVSQVPVEVTLAQRVTDNAIVPQDPLTRFVIRRTTIRDCTGAHDPVTHEAPRADPLRNAPSPGEPGDEVAVQMTTVLVQADSVIVSKTGNGSVDSADKFIARSNPSVPAYNALTPVVLTAMAASGGVFSGWTGACAAAGAASTCTCTCTVSVSGHVRVGANFALVPVVGRGATGGGTTTFRLKGAPERAGQLHHAGRERNRPSAGAGPKGPRVSFQGRGFTAVSHAAPGARSARAPPTRAAGRRCRRAGSSAPDARTSDR